MVFPPGLAAKMKTLLILAKKYFLKFSFSALFYMKTRVRLKHLVNYCLWEQCNVLLPTCPRHLPT